MYFHKKKRSQLFEYNFQMWEMWNYHQCAVQSFFDNIRLLIRKVILLMWFWCCQTRSGTTRQHTNIAHKTVVQINRFLRDITSWKLLQDEYLRGKIYFVIQYNFYYKIKKIYIQDPCLHFSFAL